MNDINIYSNVLEEAYTESVPPENRKCLGQFFTDYDIAHFMAKWILSDGRTNKILDPSMGLAIFARALNRIAEKRLQYHAYEIDKNIIKTATPILKKINDVESHVFCMDFLRSTWEEQYDAIICNPPYLKFHDYDNKENLIQTISKKTNISLTGFTNYYILFLLKSLSQLRPNGRCAFIIPLEFLNANYGIVIKKYLIQTKMLAEVITFRTQQAQFSEAITTTGIFLFENKPHSAVRFYTLDSIVDLSSEKQQHDYNEISYSELNPNIKWHIYYQPTSIIQSKNLVLFSKFATVSRGIATGANAYFLFSKSKIDQCHISASFLKPIITKSNFVKHNVFETSDFDILYASDRTTYILDTPDDTKLWDSALKTYIQSGEAQRIHERYLTRHRRPWYRLENIPPAPIWVSVFTRNNIRFILNRSGIKNLTTFHGVYPNKTYQNKLFLLFSYLLTALSKSIFQYNKRQYGDGLDKFEPNDINNALCLDLDLISKNDMRAIQQLFDQYLSCYRSRSHCAVIEDQLHDIFSKYL